MNDNIPILLKEYAVSRWTSDPYSLGGWSVLRRGASPSTRSFLGQTPFGDNRNNGGTILLAGEYTNPTNSGMVHGAYLEGVRAATWCLEQQQQAKRDATSSTDSDGGETLAAKKKRVVIIGAGATGLACARALHDSKEEKFQADNVVVLEARSRIGGRVHTVSLESSTKTAELGANWLQRRPHNPLYDLIVTPHQLQIQETDFLQPLEFPTSRRVAPDRVDLIMNEFAARCQAKAGRYSNNSEELDNLKGSVKLQVDDNADTSIQDVLDQWIKYMANGTNSSFPYTQAQLLHVMEGELMVDTGVPLSEMSSQFGMEPGVGEGDAWVVGGYDQVLQIIAEPIKHQIQLNCETTMIQSREADATATNTDNHAPLLIEYQETHSENRTNETKHLLADLVVCTVPAAVLQNEGIKFVPPLPQRHQTALHQLATSQVEKVVLRFSHRWWPISPCNNGNDYIRVHGSKFGDVSEWLDCTDAYNGVPILSGLFSGPWLRDIWYHEDGSNRCEKDIAERVVACLKDAILQEEER